MRMNNSEKLQKQINEIDELLSSRERHSPKFKARNSKTSRTLEEIFWEKSSQLKDFKSISYSLSAFGSRTPDSEFQEAYIKWLKTAKLLLESMLDEVEEKNKKISNVVNVDINLENIFNKFHLIVRQLRARYDDRVTLDVNDEYDVQDLLHALLRQHFDDIRPEERTPSYAGSSKRTDFLLKNEQVMIEVKMTRKNLKDKEVGEQLTIDIANYKEHPDCKKLVCFVYDPDGYIKNPRWLENDLAKSKEMEVKVYIRPMI